MTGLLPTPAVKSVSIGRGAFGYDAMNTLVQCATSSFANTTHSTTRQPFGLRCQTVVESASHGVPRFAGITALPGAGSRVAPLKWP
jgi:hypothetical protein